MKELVITAELTEMGRLDDEDGRNGAVFTLSSGQAVTILDFDMEQARQLVPLLFEQVKIRICGVGND